MTEEWTPTTLYRHFTSLMEAQAKAIKLAEENAAHWRSQANEWRGAMTDRERSFMTRTEIDVRFCALEDQLRDVKKAIQISAGKSLGTTAAWGYLVGAVGLIVLIVNFLNGGGP
jgi:hypothetical protein